MLLVFQLPGSCLCLLCSLLKVGFLTGADICWADSLKEYGSYVQTPMHALKGMFPMPSREFTRPSMYLPQALPVSSPCKVSAALTHSQQ